MGMEPTLAYAETECQKQPYIYYLHLCLRIFYI